MSTDRGGEGHDRAGTQRPRRHWLALAAAAALVAVCSSTLNAVFIDRTVQIYVAGAAAAAVVVSLGLWRLGLEGAPVVFGHLLVFLAVASLALFPEHGVGPAAIGETWNAATGGWNDLMRRPTPSDPSGRLITPVAMLAWATTGLVAEIVLRSRRPAVGLVPLTLGAAGFVLLGTGPSDRFGLGAAVAALALAFLWASNTGATLRSAPAGTGRSGSRMLAPSIVVGLVALGVGGGAALAHTGGERFDPRVGLAPPVELQSRASPLTELKPQLTRSDPATLFSLHLDPGPGLVLADHGPLYIRLAALDDFDGALWRTDTVYEVTGTVLDPGMAGDGDAPVMTMDVATTSDYDRQFVPVIGDPRRIGAAGVGFSTDTDTLAVRSPAPDSLFTIETSPVSALDPRIVDAVSDPGQVDPDFLAVPATVADGFWAVADGLTAPRGSGERLLQLSALLSSDRFGYSELAPSGHGLATLEAYLGGPGRPGTIDFAPRVGYAEQAASLFAVLARLDGYPARLAVGYRVQAEAIEQPTVVSEDQAWAWVEVHLSGLGWVPFDPTPTERRAVDEPEAPTITERAALPAPEVLRPGPGGGGSTGPGSGTPAPPPTRGLRWLLLGIAVLVPLPVTPLVAKWLRRRRRLGGDDPALALLGQWFEVRDRLRDLGIAIGPSFTPREVVATARLDEAIEPLSALDSLARLADTALYEPDSIGADELDRAARLADIGYDELAGRYSLVRRARGRLGITSLRPLPSVGFTAPPVHGDVAGL